jgi:hypothetical protein
MLYHFRLLTATSRGVADLWSKPAVSFQSQFWFDRNLSFGTHDRYLYTLPFHFNHLYLSYEGFQNIESNNPEILINNLRIWCNVKSIELPLTFNYDIHFVKELKMKMPKLISIKFDGYGVLSEPETKQISTSNHETEINVTTIQFFQGYIENRKDWIIYSLPYLRHLILSSTILPSIDSQLAPILNKKIQRLDIYSNPQFKQLTEISYMYFSNVQYINIYLSIHVDELILYENAVKILTNFKNLKTLFISNRYPGLMHRSGEAKLRKAVQYLERNRIMKNYQVKYFAEDCLFLKRELNDSRVGDGVLLTLKTSSFFSDFILGKKDPRM